MNNSTAPVVLGLDGPIARISFNRPTVLNAIDQAMADAFLSAVETIAATPGVRVVVLRGEGRAFMAGGDLASLSKDPVCSAQALIRAMHTAIGLLARLPLPVIASVHGAVAGAGLSLALAADLAIAADDATFNLAYARIGASPDVSGSWHLPRIVGLRKAMEIALLADTFDAQEALRLSIVNRVVPAAKLAAETQKLVEQFARGPTFAFGKIKQLLRASLDRDLQTQLDAEGDAFKACAATLDFNEGLSAFLAKRRPNFGGH